MILIDSTTRRLRVLLGGAGALPFTAAYAKLDAVTMALLGEVAVPGVTNGTTPVDVIALPPSGEWRKLTYFSLRNSSGGAVTLTIRFDDNGTARDFAAFTLDNGDVVQYAHGEGFRVFDSTGALKGGAAGSGSLTVEEVDGAPTLTATKIKFAQADGLTVTDEGGGVARINVSAAAAPDLSAQTIALLALMGF